MSTIDDKATIDKIIAANGYFMDDPRVARIVEYKNAWGGICYGVTWTTEQFHQQRRYDEETAFIREPKVIWEAK
jgi:hypothetical protein